MTPIIIVGIVVLALLGIVGIYNSLVQQRNTVRNSWSDIDVQLKRRFDLIPNLVEMVKGYAAHEKTVFEEVTAARASTVQAKTPAEREKAENDLSGTLKTLFAVAENYPQLRASENFQQLQAQLTSIESDIQSARRYYNATVREYMNTTTTFPNTVFAGMFGFGAESFFGIDEKEKENVQVKFT